MRVLLLLAILAGCAAESDPRPVVPVSETEAPAGVALVELFTSEGCSSCPPADAVLGRIAAEGQPGVLALAFHVDYWDRLGWRDSFGNAAFSTRQRAYAPTVDRRVYTPQAVVNGTRGLIGSREGDLREAIADARASPAEVSITLTTSRAGGTVTATPRADPAPDGTVLHVALVQRTTSTQVTRGENGGRRLEHTNVVREMETVAPGTDPVRLAVPPDAGEVFVAVWAQEDETGRVLGLATAEPGR